MLRSKPSSLILKSPIQPYRTRIPCPQRSHFTTSARRSLIPSVKASLGARRKVFPNPHFTTSEFPEEPLGYAKDIGAGFFQGGPGDTIGPRGRYELQAKLGWGTTSTVWLAKDRGVGEDGRHVTVKILAGYATELNEASMLLREREVVTKLGLERGKVTGRERYVARVRDQFIQPGVDKADGEHLCFVTEFRPRDVQSVQYTLHGKPFSVAVVKRILNHLAKGLAELHRRDIAHTDIKPSNILIQPSSNAWRQGGAIDAWFEKHPPQKSRPIRTPKGMKTSWLSQIGPPLLEPLENCNFVLTDFSHAEFVEDKEMPEVVVPMLRAPELIVGYPDWDTKIDIWSYGLLAFYLLTHNPLIYPALLPGYPPRATPFEAMLYQMLCITGDEFPEELIRWGVHSGKYFRSPLLGGTPELVNFGGDYEHTGPISEVLLRHASQAGVVGLNRKEMDGVSDLLTRCLRIDPSKRAAAKEIAQHPWLQ